MLEHPNCKINLGLHVIRRREDGYHDLETLFIPIPLCDELEINPSIHFSFMQTGINVGCSPEDNIVVKAFRLMRKVCGTRLPDVEICLRKHIPFGAGLGGGSSDAAFTLKMLNNIFDLGLDNDQLRTMAAQLGADCAFFVDNLPAYATGIGDNLTALDFNPLKGYTILLVKPDEAVSTAEAYRNIIPRQQRYESQTVYLPQAIKQPVGKWKNIIVNDFEQTVFPNHPRLATLKEELYSEGAIYASMSGSGATVYGLFATETTDTKHLTRRFSNYNNTFIYSL